MDLSTGNNTETNTKPNTETDTQITSEGKAETGATPDVPTVEAAARGSASDFI